MPSRGVNHVRHARVLEDDSRVLGPGATEVIRARSHVLTRGGRDGRVIDDIVGRVGSGGTARGGDGAVACGDDADVDGVEPGGGVLAEDEVCGALDEGAGKELGSRFGEDGILVAGELAAVVALVADVGTDG